MILGVLSKNTPGYPLGWRQNRYFFREIVIFFIELTFFYYFLRTGIIDKTKNKRTNTLLIFLRATTNLHFFLRKFIQYLHQNVIEKIGNFNQNFFHFFYFCGEIFLSNFSEIGETSEMFKGQKNVKFFLQSSFLYDKFRNSNTCYYDACYYDLFFKIYFQILC